MACCIREAIYQYQKKTVRKMILKDHKRPDGRALNQIRPLAAETDIVPRVHGSAMFTRGQTQICNVCTLAPLSEAQRIDGLDENVKTKRYMHHYNFLHTQLVKQNHQEDLDVEKLDMVL